MPLALDTLKKLATNLGLGTMNHLISVTTVLIILFINIIIIINFSPYYYYCTYAHTKSIRCMN